MLGEVLYRNQLYTYTVFRVRETINRNLLIVPNSVARENTFH